ncbi:MAG: MJ0042-type zinc finger domain-containing protein [Xanthobacteraceae bacterium]
MRIDCPSCGAGFDVDPKVLGPKGRTVRCASCKTKWFAAAPAFAMAENEIEPLVAPAFPAAAPVPEVSAEDRADYEARKTGAKQPEIIAPQEGDIAFVQDAPPTAPDYQPEAAPVTKRKLVSPPVAARRKRSANAPLAIAAAVLFAVISIGIMSRQAMVRAAPELASLYAAIGFPVNLRGLEFQNIRTKQEIQDGVAVLSIEGEVENIVSRAVELPRVRLAVLGDNGAEIYAWTALLPRSILYPHERVPFKSRLASPPAAGKEITVRFLTRADLSAPAR